MPASTNEGYGTSFLPQKWANGNRANPEVEVIPGQKFGNGGTNDNQYHHPHNVDNHPINPDAYFTEFTAKKAFPYGTASLYVISCSLISVAEIFMKLPCPPNEEPIKFPNPGYDGSGCPQIRQPWLLGLTPTECSFGRRLVMSIFFGGLIGWERRQADRPAGIRTMSLVSLGSCLFTINSAFAFVGGPMNWDASRISAAIPSGVGFLGAGLIFKKTNADDDNMVVHGLTTAASVWLSAAVGIACGGELYFAASFGTCLMMLLLRFGPRGSDLPDDDDEEEDEDEGDIEIVPPQDVDPEGGTLTVVSKIETADDAAMIFRSSDGGQNLPPGMQLTQRSIQSTDGSYTVTGQSIENSSLAAETTPMLGLPQLGGLQQQLGQQTSRNSQSQLLRHQQRRTPAKSMRKRQSKQANLGSIV
jgi:putative Mg2+ transporter-C (MgtC) family protein